MKRESEKHKRMVESVRLREENEALKQKNEELKNIVKNIKMYLSDKSEGDFTYFETQNLHEQVEQIERKAKYDTYQDILKYIEGKGY